MTPKAQDPSPVTVRSLLLLLLLAILLPGILAVIWLVATTYESERAANARTLRESARALSMVVDREITHRVIVARVLRQSRWLDAGAELSSGDLLKFELRAREAIEGMGGWLELRGPAGVLLDTRRPLGSAPPVPAESAAQVRTALAEALQVRPLGADGPDSLGEAHAAVIQPVQRNGRTVLNLVLTLRPVELQNIVNQQQLPAGWIGTVLDSHGRVVARSPRGSEHFGKLATADLRQQLALASEGQFESVSLDGRRTTVYFSTSPQGWTYVSAMPRSPLAGGISTAVAEVLGGALVLFGIATLGALWVSQRIVRPVYALKTAAAQMQAGEPVEFRPSGVLECDEVAIALADAAQAMRHGRVVLERQVAEAVARTRLAEQRASQSQRIEALGRLTGGVAHDFNNLLGVISNSAHLIQRHAAAADLQAPLAATLRAVQVGSQLTQHLLRFSGRRPVRPAKLCLARFLPEVERLLSSVLGSRIEVTVQVDSGTQAVRADGGELELALINLAINARDAMPSGGALRVRARNAEAADIDGVEAPAGRRYVLITVSDDGLGIEPELAARVFEPFFTTKEVGSGTGLGLSQVHGFCVQAGGAARLDSTPGLGTTVSLFLPVDEGLPEAAAPAAKTDAGPQMIAGAHVLLVEDNEELGRVTAALLQSYGAIVRRAADAAQALRQVEEQPPVDIVLSDVVMPGGMDGIALARRLRHERPGLPVVLISGYNRSTEEAGDLVVLRKPCAAEDLLRALRAGLASPSQPSAGGGGGSPPAVRATVA
jgi:signal transduction histidine kinase/CheY-like chemotaxis protein